MAETSREHEEANATNPTSKTERFVSKYFVRLLVSLAVSGGALAIFGPWLLYVTGLTGEADTNLRLHILYITGGIIAVLGLVETHRKNTVDHEKAKVEKENYKKTQAHQTSVLEEQQRQFNATMDREHAKIEADREKNNQDHRRQVLAERRSRYSQAVEQLGSPHAPIRMGGVYTLVGLADEWLEDNSLNETERHKEGQIIMNNLCAYIRSPFDLADRHQELSQDQAPENYEGGAKQFSEEQGRFREEQDIRSALMQEIRDRLRNRLHNLEHDSGPWSNFDYNFVNATFFYDIDLSGVRFTSEANFTDAVFNKSAEFTESKFTGGANFCKTRFIQDANFKFAIFMTNIAYRNVSFTQAIFKKDAIFKYATFVSKADFTKSTFTKKANFIGATFDKNIFLPGGASFTEAHFIQAPRFEGHPSNELPSTRFVQGSKNDFRVSEDSSFIETEKHRSPNGTITIIPKGCIIFDSEQPS